MIKELLRTLVGLSVAAIGTLVPTLASATVWKNYGNEMVCMGNVNGNKPVIGSDIWVKTCNGNLAQTWAEPPYTPGPSGYEWFVNEASIVPGNPAFNLCISAMPITNGAPAVLDGCSNAYQAWDAVYSLNDEGQHPCYYFQQLMAEQHGATRVLGVQGGTVVDGTHVILWDFLSTHPDQYWCAY